MINTLKIAGIPITLEADTTKGRKRKFRVFEADEKADGMKVSYKRERNLELPETSVSFDDTIKWSDSALYIIDRDLGEVVYKASADAGWKEVIVSCGIKEARPINSFLCSLGEIAFRNRILYYDGLVIHGSAIQWEEKGIVFSGPSGMGKTTQSKLWKKYKKAEMINDDRPAIRVIDSRPYVYGTLWNGARGKGRNKSAPLSAIVLLEQSKQNTIVRLSREEAVNKLMPRSFLPYNSGESMDRALKNLEMIVTVTPVFYLKCRPDREAVELLYQCLK
ncbi:phosphoenolpyruvate carboxykinase (ATP) [Anaerocolumna xylanovorans]|uniref:SynChlorMet cassette protein ScmC n=1 Tax=Anaerocolumna xylanovorans DSM 12503 TaxID=1121345 RepID=A0A1M7YAF6_9FIRM|nr:hypothetical protein [Anaerocolumna xylanovorans]SHO49571.1 hypothetical protein SAMN02745217_02391 [Anaerocolumna xylanovorans DSM 12503]